MVEYIQYWAYLRRSIMTTELERGGANLPLFYVATGMSYDAEILYTNSLDLEVMKFVIILLMTCHIKMALS